MAMNFTVTRAVRGADSPVAAPDDRLRPVVRIAPVPAARMDLPYADLVLRLELNDFAETVPAEIAA